jgi:hypothetical protein
LLTVSQEVEFYAEAKRLWEAATNNEPDNPDVLSNAAWFLGMSEPDAGESLLEAAALRFRKAEWFERLATYLASIASLNLERRSEFAERSIEAAHRAFEIEPQIEKRFDLLGTMRENARLMGRVDSLRAVRQADKVVDVWRAGRHPNLDQLALAIRGFVAIAAGDLVGACANLCAVSGDGLEDATLGLASELLSLGCKTVVVETLRLWSDRMRALSPTIEKWIETIDAGGVPTLAITR